MGRDGGQDRPIARDLRDVRPLSGALVVSLMAVSVTQSLVFDLGRYGADRRSVVAAALSLVTQAVAYVVLAAPSSRLRPSGPRATLAGAAYVAAAAAKSVVLVRIATDADRAAELALRLPGDLTFAGLLWVALAVAVATRARHVDTRARLERTRRELLERRTSRTAVAREIDERLRQQAADALGSELQGIAEALGPERDRSDLRTLPADLEALIERRVRPLARALSAHADLVDRIEPRTDLHARVRTLPSLRLDPRRDLRVTGPYLAASLNILATVTSLATLRLALAVQAASLVLWVGLLGLRRLWPRGRTVGIGSLLVGLPAVTLVPALPMLAVIRAASTDQPSLAPVRVTAVATILLFVQLASIWTALRRARDAELAEVARVAAQLERELALLDQAAWVAQRRWSSLIHGTVQGALTVARSRLLTADEVTPEVVARVLADVERAKAALAGPSTFGGSAAQLLGEVAEAWEGLCDLELDIAPDVLAEVERDTTSATCLVELVKELVSNAHRHGGATRIRISAVLDDDRELTLVCVDDGAPVPMDVEPGLGFRMFDELTRWWRIDRADGVIRAAIPLG